MMEQDVKAQHTPSDAAKRKACELANAQGHAFILDRVGRYFPEPKPGFLRENAAVYALALHLDEVDRVARGALNAPPLGPDRPALICSLMLPDPPDPDEELAREIAEQFATIYPHAAEEVSLATIKRLREQGRLTDAK